MTSAEAPPPMSRKLAGFDAAELLAGVGDDVERRHDQAGAVADDADLAVELDVVEVLLLGALPRAGRPRRCPRAPSWSAWRKPAFSSRVTLPSRATTVPSRRLDQRVDLDQRGVLRVKTSHS